MSRSSPSAPKTRLTRLLALAAGLLVPGSLAAQTADPFALPQGVSIKDARTADQAGPGLSEIAIDRKIGKRMVDLKWIDGALAISAESAEAAGLPMPASHGAYIPLSQFEIAEWGFDRLSQRLSIKLYRKGDGPNDVNVARRDFADGAPSSLFAAMVDYDFSLSRAGGRTELAASVAPRLSYGNFSAQSHFTYQSSVPATQSKLVRLDTQATYALPSRNLQVTVGDTITAGSQSQRALRIGGLQIGTDFALRPDLITMPLPDFYGRVSVPTSLDLVINDQRFLRSELEAGDYQVRNIPFSNGRGEISVVLTDPTGREVVQSTRVYVSPEMLAKGLWQGAANVGWIRRRYGEVSNDYGDLAGTFFLRRGVTRTLTLGVSGEMGAGVKNLGGEALVTLFDRAMAFGEIRFSSAPYGSGRLLRGGIESQGEDFGVRLEAIWPSAGYRDIAAMTGDPLPVRQVLGSASYNINNAYRFDLTAGRQWTLDDPGRNQLGKRVDILRARFGMPIGKRININSEFGYRRSEGRSGLMASLGLSLRLGGGHAASAHVTRASGRTMGQVGLTHMDVLPGDIGYAARALVGGGSSAFSAMGAYRSTYGRVSAEANVFDGELSLRGNATGTLIFAGNSLFARNRTQGSFALVKTGDVGGVMVTHENREIGVTNGKGVLLVENVTPLVPIQFDIKPERLPADAVAKATYQRVVVSRGGVGLVDMDVRAYRSQPVRITDSNGLPLPSGTQLVAQPSGEVYTVAFDGMLDFNALSKDRSLEASINVRLPCPIAIPALPEDNFDVLEIRAECSAGTTIAAESASRVARLP